MKKKPIVSSKQPIVFGGYISFSIFFPSAVAVLIMM